MPATSPWSAPKDTHTYMDISAATPYQEVRTFAPKVDRPASTIPLSNIYYLPNPDKSNVPTNKQIDDFFTYDKESYFSKLLESLNLKSAPDNEVESIATIVVNQILRGGEIELALLITKINEKWFSIDLITAICDKFGRVDILEDKNLSLRILTALLHNPSAQIRDEAALGLALLDDKRAIPALEQSAEREKVSIVKEGFLEVVNQLKAA